MTHKIFKPLFIVGALSLTACASAPEADAAAQNVVTDTAQIPVTESPIVETPTSQTSISQALSVLTAENQTALSLSEKFSVWKTDFMRRAVAKGYDRALVERVIGGASLNEKAIVRDRDQPEFTKPIWSYVDGAANPGRVSTGQAKLRENTGVFSAVEARYGVDRHVLTAIWGLESAYGKIMGRHDIVSALATLAFEGRRAEFGERELFGILDSLRDGYVRSDQLKGSWAGAMGMMQFIPTTFRDYAVDFDGNGNRDLWTSEADALGSAAHYLSRHGWRQNEPVFTEVALPRGFDYSKSDGSKMRVADWKALGVNPFGGAIWSPAALGLEGKLLVPAGHMGPKFITFKNFDVIKKYNNSTSYAMGINVLAEGLKDRPAISALWPTTDKQLSRTDKEAMQRRLTALGYDTKGVDGQIGPNSRRAIRAWQSANGVPADGYVEQKLFRRIMGR